MKFLDHLTIVFQTFDHGRLQTKSKLMIVRLNFFLITSLQSNFNRDIQITIGQSNINQSSTCKSFGVMLDEHFCNGSPHQQHMPFYSFSHPEH